jgi:hypothetical protein
MRQPTGIHGLPSAAEFILILEGSSACAKRGGGTAGGRAKMVDFFLTNGHFAV